MLTFRRPYRGGKRINPLHREPKRSDEICKHFATEHRGPDSKQNLRRKPIGHQAQGSDHSSPRDPLHDT